MKESKTRDHPTPLDLECKIELFECSYCGGDAGVVEQSGQMFRAQCLATCGASWPWRETEKDARADVTPWLVRVGPTLRHTSVRFMGREVSKLTALSIDCPLEDVGTLTLEVLTLDGVTIEWADGAPIDLKRISLREEIEKARQARADKETKANDQS